MCGNFVLIGYDSGYVDKYNIQSGKIWLKKNITNYLII